MRQTKAIKASNLWKNSSITEDLNPSPITKISKEWMLITAGDKNDWNTMTASWGGIGYLWERNVAFAFIRPTRQTYEFAEKNSHFTLTFFDKALKTKVHKVCGNKSGRDIDKAAAAGITPIYFEENVVSFEEASEIIVCRKIYVENFKPDNFIDSSIEKFYPEKDYHRIYIGEIEKYYKK